MPDPHTLLEQLEEWLDAQVPHNLHELPHRMFETVERVTNELFDALNVHGPPSISLPFPPFGKEPPPPPPPPPAASFLPFTLPYPSNAVDRAQRLFRAHPYAASAGAALVLGVGIGAAGLTVKRYRDGKFGVRARERDGRLVDVVVLLAPSPMPPMLWALTISLLRAGYVVVVAVANVADAEQLEKRMTGLECKDAMRVLIYDPQDAHTFPPFERSLRGVLNLQIHAPDYSPSMPYVPSPSSQPRIHAYISLYPLHPDPPRQPKDLPALPALLDPQSQSQSSAPVPKLITLYPASAALVQPDTFASQILRANHQLLARNVAAFSGAHVVSVHVGDLQLPSLHTMIVGTGPNGQMSRRQLARQRLLEAHGARGRVAAVYDYFKGGVVALWRSVAAQLGLFGYARNYEVFEHRFLQVLKGDVRSTYHLGHQSYLALFLAKVVPRVCLPLALRVLPALPDARGPMQATVQGMPAPRRPLGGTARGAAPGAGGDAAPQRRGDGTPRSATSNAGSSASASASEHEASGAEDMSSSFHTTGTTSSSGSRGSGSGSGTGMEDSWVGLDTPPMSGSG